MSKPYPYAAQSAASVHTFDILPETDTHLAAVEALHVAAFGPGRFARAAFRVREQGAYDQALSFVAYDGDTLLGSVRLTWIAISDSGSCGLLLGPLAVVPGAQNKGIGKALVAQCLDAAKTTDAGYVMLVGDQPYYGPLGFQVAPKGQIQMPGPVDVNRLLVCPLGGFDVTGMTGMVRHADLHAAV